MANQLEGKIMQISTVQGLEPKHFIKMFSGKMTVFFSEKMKFSKTDCFLVKFGNVYAYIPDPKESCIIYSSEVHLFLNNYFNIYVCMSVSQTRSCVAAQDTKRSIKSYRMLVNLGILSFLDDESSSLDPVYLLSLSCHAFSLF